MAISQLEKLIEDWALAWSSPTADVILIDTVPDGHKSTDLLK